MDRRGFLKTAPVVAATPFSMRSADSVPRTTRELERAIEGVFECVDGEPAAGWDGVSWGGDYGAVVYVAFSNGILKPEGSAAPGCESEEAAVVGTWHAFLGYATGKKGRLYWRTRPEYRIATVDEQKKALKEQMRWDGYSEAIPGSGLYYSKEAVEDKVTDALVPVKIADRLGTPERDLHYVYMRFAITERVPFKKRETGDHYRVEPDGTVWKREGRIA